MGWIKFGPASMSVPITKTKPGLLQKATNHQGGWLYQ
jgi:hypothetical protein